MFDLLDGDVTWLDAGAALTAAAGLRALAEGNVPVGAAHPERPRTAHDPAPAARYTC